MSDEAGTPSPTKTDSLDLSSLANLARTGPPWARNLAMVTVILTGTAPWIKIVYDGVQKTNTTKLLESTTAVQSGASPYAGKGIEVSPSAAADHASDQDKLIQNTDDLLHLQVHEEKNNEDPTYTPVYNDADKGLLAFRVFSSDGCVEIKHKKNGRIKTDLVRGIDLPPGNSSQKQDPERLAVESSGLALDPRIDLSQLTGLSLAAESAQDGCINPHPGQFRFWSGPSTNNCWGPVFRQFPDGCTHYQMFNRCQKTWDPQVHWTVCKPQHNH